MIERDIRTTHQSMDPKQRAKKAFCLILFIELAVLLILFATVIIDHNRSGESREYMRVFGKDDFQFVTGAGSSSLSDENPDTQNAGVFVLKNDADVVLSDPISLESGSYLLSVEYLCHGKENKVFLFSRTLSDSGVLDTDKQVNPDPRNNNTEVGITLPDGTDDLQIGFLCQEKDGFRIDHIELREVVLEAPFSARLLSTGVIWLLLTCVLDIFLYFFLYFRENRRAYIVLCASALLVSLPVLIPSDYLRCGDDISFHILRVFGIRDGILRGIPWVKLQRIWYNDYGYLVGACYGDLLLYLPALANIAGVRMGVCYQGFVLVINFLTTFSAYFCFSRIFGRRAGLTGSIVYIFLFYRIINVYKRAAVGEYCAMAFLPFLAYAVYLLYKDEYFKSMLMFVIGFSGVINTHIISLEVVGLVMTLFFLVEARKTFVAKRIVALICSAAAVILVNLHFLVPFLDVILQDKLLVTDNSSDLSLNQHGIKLLSILFPDGTADVQDVYHFGAIPIVIILFAVLFYLWNRASHEREKRDGERSRGGKGPILCYSGFALLGVVFSSAYFPWDQIAQVPGLKALVTSIQYPWRFLTISGLFAVMALCEMLREDRAKSVRAESINRIVIVLFALIGTLFAVLQYQTFVKVNFDAPSDIISYHCHSNEYLLSGTDPFDTERKVWVNGDVSISGYEKDGDHVRFEYSAETDGYIELPLFNYRYYQVRSIDPESGKGSEVSHQSGSNNRIQIPFAQGTKGTIDVRFRVPVLWLLGLILSMISIAGIVVYALVFRRRVRTEGSCTHDLGRFERDRTSLLPTEEVADERNP